MHPRILLACAALAALVPVRAPADEAQAQKRPVLLLVSTASDAASAGREIRFLDELALAIDGVSVERVQAGDPGFAVLPLADQIALIRPLAGQRAALAATWIRATAPDRVLLHVVALSEGRAVVRVVEAGPGAVAESQLALATRELLREAHLLDQAAPAPQPPSCPAPASAAVCPLPAESKRPEWGAVSLLVADGGIAGQTGPSFQLGMGLGLEWQPEERLFARLSLAGKAGPRAELRDGIVTAWSVEPGLAVGYGWLLGAVAIGPFVGLAAPWTAADMVFEQGDTHGYSWWDFRGTVGLDARLPVSRIAAIVIEGAASVLANHQTFERRSDGSTILATPYAGWSASAGAVFFVDAEP
jgi:hypothetical protein